MLRKTLRKLTKTKQTFLSKIMTKATKLDQVIGEKIRINRIIRKRSRLWLGEKLEISEQQIRYYEIGKHRVSASCLYSIANFLKTSINEFFPEKND